MPRCSPQISYGVSTVRSRLYRHTKSARDKQVGKSLMGNGEVQRGNEYKKNLNEKCNKEDNRVLFVARHWWMLWPFADLLYARFATTWHAEHKARCRLQTISRLGCTIVWGFRSDVRTLVRGVWGVPTFQRNLIFIEVADKGSRLH